MVAQNDLCKYILSVFVHKDNKDISTRPIKLPPGLTRASVRDMAQISTMKEQVVAKEREHPVSSQRDVLVDMERYGVVEFQSNKAKVE